MTDLTEEDVYNAFDKSLTGNLQTYTKGRGQYYLQVYVANKEYKEFADGIVKNSQLLDESNKLTKENNNKLTKANDAITANTEAQENNTENTKENTKSSKENTEALKAYSRRLVEVISKTAGFFGGMVKQEMELTNSLSESNTMYKDTAKELNSYANRMNMTLEEYSQFMKENAAEFNTLQRQFGDVREATALNWKEISAQSGATQGEMNKALASYTKLITQNGEINNMTTKEFVNSSSEYIIQTKLLAKAMGTSTDAVLKQTEQAQKQWQYDVLMRDPNKRAQIQVAEMMGHSMDRILYEVGGIMSEGAAMEMALSPAARMESEEFRRRSANGELETVEDMKNMYTDLSKNPQFIQLQEQQNQMVKENSQTIIYAGQEFAKAITAGTGEIQQKIKNFAELDFDEEREKAINKNQASIVEFDGTIKEINNDARALMMSGSKLSENLDILTNGMKWGKEKVDDWIAKHPELMELLQDFIGKLGIAGLALTMLSTPLSFVWKIGQGIYNLLPGTDKFGRAMDKLTNKLPKLGDALGKLTKGAINNAGAIGTAVYASVKAKNAYEEYQKGNTANAIKEGIKGTVTAAAYGIVRKVTGSDKLAGGTAALFAGGLELTDKIASWGGAKIGNGISAVSRWWNKGKGGLADLPPEERAKILEEFNKTHKVSANTTEMKTGGVSKPENFEMSVANGVYKYNGKDVSSPTLHKAIQDEFFNMQNKMGDYAFNKEEFEEFKKKRGIKSSASAMKLYDIYREQKGKEKINSMIRDAALQDNKPANIADSQVQNKADIQAEAKIKAEAEAEAQQSKEEQKQTPQNEVMTDTNVKDEKTKTVKLSTEDDMQTKLSQMVSLMTEMTNQLGQMVTSIPMNNYQQV